MMSAMKALMLVGLHFTAADLNIPTKEIASGVNLPYVSMGTWTEGTKSVDKDVSAIVNNWLDLGGIGIDTAWVYFTQGDIAKVLKDRGTDRKKLFITSKFPTCLGSLATRKFIESNLKSLQTDYIDLMLIHFPTGDNCSAAWATLEDYHAKGVLKAIGVSHFNRTHIDSLKKTMKVAPHVNQILLNVLTHDDDQIAATQEIGTKVEAYCPLGRNGQAGDIPGNPTIQAIAKSHNVSTYQVALKWILQKGHLLTFQSANPAHQESDADVFKFNLTSDELKQLDNLQKQSIVV